MLAKKKQSPKKNCKCWLKRELYILAENDDDRTREPIR